MRGWWAVVALIVALVAGTLPSSPAASNGFQVGGPTSLSVEQFVDVTDASLPLAEKVSDERVWAEWLDTDGDGLVDRRPSYGVAFGDANGDGFVDLWVTNHFGDRIGPPPSLFINRGDGTFSDEIDRFDPGPDGNIATGDRHGSIFADFDNDGDQDLLMLVGLANESETSRSKIFINEDGRFVDRGTELGVGYASARSREAAIFDLDNDGLLDFLHAANFDGTKDGELPPTIFRQNGDGTFADTGADVGFEFNRGYGLEHAAMVDVNGDGRLDMVQKQPFTVFDMSSGAFVDITPSVFTDIKVENQRGLNDFAVADFNRDLVPDFFLPSSAVNAHQLILSSPTGWQDVSETSGVRDVPYLTTDGGGIAVGDFDNDADLDLFVLDRTLEGSDYLLENAGDGTFSAIPFPLTARQIELERPDLRSAAVADVDNDGALDLLETTNRNDPTYRLLRNQGNDHRWLSVVLQGAESNRDGIGATVEVAAGGIVQMRQQAGGVHHRVQDDMRLHFGLADAEVVDEVRIRWPSGAEQVVTDVGPDQEIVIVEAAGVSAGPGSVETDDEPSSGADPDDDAGPVPEGDNEVSAGEAGEAALDADSGDEGSSGSVVLVLALLGVLGLGGGLVMWRRRTA